MPVRAGAILAAVAVAAGAAAAERGGGLWDPRGAPAPAGESGGLTAEGRASKPVCELERADRASTPSLRCMGCHDGSAGASIEFHMAPGANGMSHPVEVDYAGVAARQPDRYHPAQALPREIPLVNGKVACTSCHDGASPDPKRVVAVPRLCESCHDL